MVTSTATIFATVTTIVTTVTNPRKREAEAKFDHRVEVVNTLAARQQTVMPSKVPSYASACSCAVRYSSACSCIGVTKQTTTVAAPTTTSISTSTITVTPTIVNSVTITQTTTVDATATATCTSFYLRAQGSTAGSEYAVLPGTPDETITSFTSDANSAAVFNLDGSGNLLQNLLFANTDQFSPSTIFFDPAGTFSDSPQITCIVPSAAGGPLSCTGYTNSVTVFQLCPSGCTTANEPCGGVALGTGVDSRCQALSFNAVPAC